MDLTTAQPIAILASGRGSNFDAIAAAARAGILNAQIIVVASDQANAPVLLKAQALGIETLVEKDQDCLADELLRRKVEFVVLAGYMRILKEKFIQTFWDARGFARIVNIHPSLLPKYPGLGGYRQAYEANEPTAGVTIHFVDQGVDTGPVCAQQEFSLAGCKSAEEVEARGLAIEHTLYAETLNWILNGQFRIENRGGRIHVQPH